MSKQWSEKQAGAWYDKQPWMRGCNYLPSDCCNRIAFWQSLDFEQHLTTADRELELAASIGFNSIRVILEFIVWNEEHDSFLERFERFLSVAAKHGISLMVCFANDCTVPKDENYRPPRLGPQHYDWGYHGGRKNSPHSGYRHAIGYDPALDEPENAERFFGMVAEIVGKYANDPRIAVWDLINEPGNGNRGEVSVPNVKRLFEVARSMSPSQPLTSGVWRMLDSLSAAEKTALELSDVVSFHNYGDLDYNVRVIAELRRLGRPLFNTEWLNRIRGCNVCELFPLYYLEKVSCWNWGFVAGLSQTYEPSDVMWSCYEADPTLPYDFTKWMHDLFRPSLHPYDPREIACIRRFCRLADVDAAGGGPLPWKEEASKK